MLRDDLSANLIHLTRGDTDEEAARAFVSILASKKLRGSSRDIRGGYACVCFTEAPPAKLAVILSSAAHQPVRYKPFGVMVTKEWLFRQGGRPAIYQPNTEFELLHEQQRYRHVRYEPGFVDYTWEREWRVRAESIALDPEQVTLVVPTRAWERWALQRHAEEENLLSRALDGVCPITPYPWHFAVLEDMGFGMPAVVPPAP